MMFIGVGEKQVLLWNDRADRDDSVSLALCDPEFSEGFSVGSQVSDEFSTGTEDANPSQVLIWCGCSCLILCDYSCSGYDSSWRGEVQRSLFTAELIIFCSFEQVRAGVAVHHNMEVSWMSRCVLSG